MAATGKKPRRRRLPVVLAPHQIDALNAQIEAAIAAARTPKKRQAALRDRAMVQTALFAGLRVSELCNLDVPDVDLLTPQICVRRGKGDKDRNIPVAARLMPLLAAWIGQRREGPLFTGPGGRRLAPRTFQARLEALGRKAQITKRVHPHLMRHSFATSLLEKPGATIFDVKELMGHESIQTTSIYLHTTTKRLKGVVDLL